MITYNTEKQHLKNKYHAIERIQLLLDENTFFEIGKNINNINYQFSDNLYPYDGVICGKGKINGKNVFIFSQDFTINGGTIGLNHGKKIANIINLAIKSLCPLIGIYDSGGARISEGVDALAGCGEMLHNNVLASGKIPQYSIVLGPCAGAAAYSPILTDFVFMVNNISHLFITGNKVIEKVTGEKCTLLELGGPSMHSFVSGTCHKAFETEKECFREIRRLIGLLPSNYINKDLQAFDGQFQSSNKKINNFFPKDSKKPYSMISFINCILDTGSFYEIQPDFAKNIIIGFGKISGITIGVVANNPLEKSGSLDIDSSVKSSRFVRFCDSFNIPIITFVDTPGYLPGIEQEKRGIIRNGAKLLYAFSEATCIKLTFILGKAFGGAYIAMGSKHLKSDFSYSLQGAEFGIMNKESANEITRSNNLQTIYQNCSNKYEIFKKGYIDAIIRPDEIRKLIFDDINLLKLKSSFTFKHGNIPL